MIGNSGRLKIFAFIFNNLLATVAAFLAVAALKSCSLYLGGRTFRLTYLDYFLLCKARCGRAPLASTSRD